MSKQVRWLNDGVRYWPTAGEGKHAQARHNNGIPTGVFVLDKGDYTGRHRAEETTP